MTRLYEIKDLAKALHIHYRTALTELRRLQVEFPDKEKYPFLHRKAGKRDRFSQEDIGKIIDILPK
jgi:hypothetical protein|tara:strand:+ start:374 stop:571 length:198 start_codon:yes stop_codon:yes gene_type:complete